MGFESVLYYAECKLLCALMTGSQSFKRERGTKVLGLPRLNIAAKPFVPSFNKIVHEMLALQS